MTSWQKPTPDQISQFRLLALRPEEERYFFARLQNPLWLDALYDIKALMPPPPVTVEEGTSYPHWPISRFIARIAGSHPDQAFVATVLAGLAQTKNVAVQGDLMEAMTSLQPNVLTNLLPAVADWLREPGAALWTRGRAVARLADHALRDSRNTPPVRVILSTYLQSKWDDRGDSPSGVPTTESQDATEFADEFAGGLVESGGELFLGVVLEHMGAVLEREFPTARLVNGLKEDYSSTFRWDMSSVERLSNAGDLLTFMASRAVDALASSASQNPGTVIRLLDGGGWIIHQRLALRFLTLRSGDDDIRDETCSRLANPDLARLPQLRREYDELLGAAFAGVGEQESAEILSSLGVAAELRSEDSERWLYERLALISEHLTGDWAQRFSAYAERFGAPREPTPPLSIQWKAQPEQSPLEAGKAGDMSAAHLAAFARDWTLPEDEEPWERPNWRGLAEDIKGQVRARPAEFSIAAHLFADLNPTVVAAVLGGLKDAVSSGDLIDWMPTLDLLKKTAEREETSGEYADLSVEQDSSWSVARSEGLHLIEAGLGSDESPPAELAPLFWEAIELFAARGRAPDGVVAEQPRDSVFAALNATQSRAVYTSMVYLWWLRGRGLGRVPEEVDGFFRRILNPQSEPFIGMRAAVAHRLPQLAYVDADWTVGLLPDVFPDRADWTEHWDAAWYAYVRYATPLPPEPILKAMEGYYTHAVQLIDPGHEVGSEGDPVLQLGMHLVLMYLHGMIKLDHRNLVAFFNRAPEAARPRILDWIGRMAEQDDLPTDWFERAQKFFEWREREIAASGLDRTELRKLGWFVASGRFQVQWWGRRLPDALKAATNRSEAGFIPLDDMMNRVADISEDEPAMALEVLEVVVSQAEWGWHGLYLDPARTIITQAIEVPDLRFRARQVADRLARDGHDEFEQLAAN